MIDGRDCGDLGYSVHGSFGRAVADGRTACGAWPPVRLARLARWAFALAGFCTALLFGGTYLLESARLTYVAVAPFPVPAGGAGRGDAGRARRGRGRRLCAAL
jgi:hypothetical protein